MFKELSMNTANYKLLVAGFLALVLAGCFNPASADFYPPETPVAAAAEPDSYEPFTVSVHIGEDEDRSIAGPDANRIKEENIRNFIQVIVLNSDNKVVALAEDRRTDFDDDTADLSVRKIHYGETYKILVLQGHWSRNGFENDETTYKYVESEPPTLLAAGYKSQEITGPSTVKVTCYPIWVDTKFTSTTPVSTVEAALPVLGTAPKTALDPGNNWTAQWTVQRSDGKGLWDLIMAAEGSSLFTDETALGWIPPAAETPTNLISFYRRNGSTIRLDITSYISQVGMEGAVNFNLKYVPFSLSSSSGAWTGVTSAYFSGVPEWIIRNGVNDAAQDEYTTFDLSSNWDGIDTSKGNGNGAVAFKGVIPEWDGTGRFVTVATNITQGQAAWSGDGQTWRAATLPSPGMWSGIAYGDGVFVTVAYDSDQAARSEDGGRTWTTALLPSKAYWQRIAFGGGVFVTVASDSGLAAWSGDGGQSWEEAPLPTLSTPPSKVNWANMAYGNGVFVMIGSNTNKVIRFTNSDKTWTESTPLPSSTSNNWSVIAYGDGVFVAGSPDNEGYKTAWSDDGGNSWEEMSLPSDFGYWGGLAYGDDVFVAVATSSWAVRSEDRGKTWTKVLLPNENVAYLTPLAYGNGVFVTIGAYTNKVLRSTDRGKSWTESDILRLGTGWGGLAYGERP
jgi:photosystem II stability/assembly factor-like uncharacterized protein